MIIYIFLFINTFITSHVYAMETPKESSIITDFIFTKKIITKYKLPQQIIPQIQQFCIQTRKKDIKNSHPYNNTVGKPAWNDFGIPKAYLYYLTPQQGDCLQKYFMSPVIMNHYKEKERVEMIYLLESKEDYKIFKTIPIEIRRYLTKIPKSSYESFGYSNTDVNEYKVLRLEYDEDNKSKFKAKFIIHEEKVENAQPIIHQVQRHMNYD